MKKAVILGAGGFIGSHLAKKLVSQGYQVRGVDVKYPKYLSHKDYEFVIADLRDPASAKIAIPHGTDEVYQLAADMGGAGFIFSGMNDADIFSNNALINLNVANTVNKKEIGKIFYSSSACAYSQDWQKDETNNKLAEHMAYPANPDSDYGWEKLFSERLYQAYNRNYDLNIRIARFHNIYGPMGEFYNGREKAPAATCRKVYMANPKGEVEVWGSGNQIRTFLYIDDCLDAIQLLMKSDHIDPINIGSEQFISINDLTQMVINIANKDLSIKNIKGPVGVSGRSSDNTKIQKVLNWEPKINLQEGMKHVYCWISQQIGGMHFLYENDGKGNERKFIMEENVSGNLVKYYF